MLAALVSATRTTFTLVPYKGISAMMTDLMASRLDVAAANLGVAIPLLKAGKLRTLGVLNSRRSPALPDLPTLQEQGIEDFDYQNWLGYVAPARTPPAVVNRLNGAFLASIRSPEVVAALEGEGKLPWGATPQEFGQRIATELARWRQLARETGYRLE